MARPIHLRNAHTLLREVAALERLQKAIQMDNRFGPELSSRAVQVIDVTIRVLHELRFSI